MLRRVYEIEGIVQGVGFRPGIYRLSLDANVGGWIKNYSGKVKLAIEGSETELDYFLSLLGEKLPKQAVIQTITLVKEEICVRKSAFRILASDNDITYRVSIPADLAICPDCIDEINDPDNRRFQYPFTTCVNCGPRYTIVNALPYDRCRTTMSEFPLCHECNKEYSDPADRRFHAESIACNVCGPKLFWCDSSAERKDDIINPLPAFKQEIKAGKIVAVKGIGGYLLAADAFNRKTIETLRTRKKRPHKPFAVMAKNIDVVKKYCCVTQLEEDALKSKSAPIVIMEVKDADKLPLDLLSPDTNTIGVMLPYSPMHLLLFDDDIDLLIMTSGNKRSEPICINNEEAYSRLRGIADAYLCHDRKINLRNDDSLCVKQNSRIQLWRRARGFAPEAIALNNYLPKVVLAMGAELKNTLTLAYENEAIISPHIGDLETPEAVDGLKETIEYFPEFFRKIPEIIAIDLHPDMHSTLLGKQIAEKFNIGTVRVQHHFAHAAACMAEHGLEESLALVYDGTGLGTDGNIWGGELLYVNSYRYKRLATFKPAPLPGGDVAVYNPVRQLIARWFISGRSISEKLKLKYNISEKEFAVWRMQCEKGINAPLSHAAGRLFDAFSVMIGLSHETITYEGQAAIKLETEAEYALKKAEPDKLYKLPFSYIESDNLLQISWDETFNFLSDNEILNQSERDDFKNLRAGYALSFHEAVAEAAMLQLEYALSKIKTQNLVLTGGVFMNKILTRLVADMAERKFGLKVYIHEKTPPNDGAISLGQAIVAGYTQGY